MNKTIYFNEHLLLDQHVRILVGATISKLAFVLSLKEALDGKDALDEEERFSDETFESQDKFNQILLSSLKGVTSYSQSLKELILTSRIIPEELMDDITACLSFKEQDINDEFSVFYPYGITKKGHEEAINEFYVTAVYIFRTYHWLTDIETGMQEYGVGNYIIPLGSDEDVSANVTDGIMDLTNDELKKELSSYLIPSESDTDEMQEEKMALKQLLSYIGQTGDKKHE